MKPIQGASGLRSFGYCLFEARIESASFSVHDSPRPRVFRLFLFVSVSFILISVSLVYLCFVSFRLFFSLCLSFIFVFLLVSEKNTHMEQSAHMKIICTWGKKHTWNRTHTLKRKCTWNKTHALNMHMNETHT